MLNKDMLALGTKRSTIRELFEYGKKLSEKIGPQNVFDFSLGNPSIPAPDEVNGCLKQLIDNTPSVVLHGYTSAEGDRAVREKIATYITREHGARAFSENIYMTAGAAAALSCALKAILSEGDEVVLLAPYFPEYKVFTESNLGKTVIAPCRADNFRPDVAALCKAITHKCAAVIINSPNNPSGAVYTEEDIRDIAEALKYKAEEYGHPIYIIADEPYRELVYGEKTVPFIPNYYANTIVCYSFSKSLSIPGERIGYVFVSPCAEDSMQISAAVAGAGRALGYVCAPSMLQRLVAECLGKTSDISLYQKNRDILTSTLREYGYTVPDADGAFYLFVKSPLESAKEFSDVAKEMGLLLVPSDDFGFPGFVRIAYCQSEDMILRALPKFKELIDYINNRR